MPVTTRQERNGVRRRPSKVLAYWDVSMAVCTLALVVPTASGWPHTRKLKLRAELLTRGELDFDLTPHSKSFMLSQTGRESEMQAKEIPEIPVLQFLESLGGQWANWMGLTEFDNPRSVLNAMPVGTLPKLALAKMRALMKRGLVEGCPCGCRGDFVITPAGIKVLRAAQPSSGNKKEQP
jgi:hypothetical protein